MHTQMHICTYIHAAHTHTGTETIEQVHTWAAAGVLATGAVPQLDTFIERCTGNVAAVRRKRHVVDRLLMA
jgi:hypothetical protein